MIRRFDRDAKFSIAAAYDVALELEHGFLGAEHLIFGLAKIARHLMPKEVPAAELKRHLATLIDRRPGRTGEVLAKSDELRNVMAAATDRAMKRGESVITAEDLVWALGGIEGRAAAVLLREVGLASVEERSEATPGGAALDPLDFIHLSDSSELPYYDQIAASIKEAVAAGILIPGDRLPAIRQLAQVLDLAPGTVARSYKSLEAGGVVITGARGTVVAAPGSAKAGDSEDRIKELAGLLRPVAVSAFHLGGTAEELFEALQISIRGVFTEAT